MINLSKKLTVVSFLFLSIMPSVMISTWQDSGDIEELTLQVYKKDPWGFIGKKFYDGPIKFVRENYGAGETLAAGLGVFLGGLIGVPILSSLFKDVGKNDGALIASLYIFSWSAVGLGVMITTAKFKRESILAEAYKKTLNDFLDNWSVYREYTPQELLEFFDSLQDSYETDEDDVLDNKRDEVFSFVIQQLCKHDKRYRSKFKEKEKTLRCRFKRYYCGVTY